jgi:hypothetical protein
MKTVVLVAASNTIQSIHAKLIWSQAILWDLHWHRGKLSIQTQKRVEQKRFAGDVTSKSSTRTVAINTVRGGGYERSLLKQKRNKKYKIIRLSSAQSSIRPWHIQSINENFFGEKI